MSINTLYPIFLNVRSRKCLIVGGSHAAVLKVVSLKQSGATIRIIAPFICQKLRTECDGTDIEIIERNFLETDLDGCFLVLCCTNDPSLHDTIQAQATQRSILCHRADDAGKSDFHIPAVACDQEIKIAVSTNGAHPHLAKKIADASLASIDSDWRLMIWYLFHLRTFLKEEMCNASLRSSIIEKAMNDLEYIRKIYQQNRLCTKDQIRIDCNRWN